MSDCVVYLFSHVVKALLKFAEILVCEYLSDCLEDCVERTGKRWREVRETFLVFDGHEAETEEHGDEVVPLFLVLDQGGIVSLTSV